MLIAALSWHPFRAVLSTGNILPCWEFFLQVKKWSQFNSSFWFLSIQTLITHSSPHVCKAVLSHKGLVYKSPRACSAPHQAGLQCSSSGVARGSVCSKGCWIAGLRAQLVWLSFSWHPQQLRSHLSASISKQNRSSNFSQVKTYV